MAEFWIEAGFWQGISDVDGVRYWLETTDDRSFVETTAYIWRARDGRLMHLTSEERAQLPE